MNKEEIKKLDNKNLVGQLISHAHTFGDMVKNTQDFADEILCRLEPPVSLRDDSKRIMMSRVWAMPNKWTFAIPAIKSLLNKYNIGKRWADPFAGENSPAELTNDIEGRGAKYKLDALEFLKVIVSESIGGVLFDPPYSVEQCLRKYTPKFNGTAGRAEYWAKCKDEIARIVEPNGIAISFCWDSTGMGKKRGFEIIEILLVAHGACHNDTIITVEQKVQAGLF